MENKYGGGCVNALDTLSFYKNGKADCPPETGEFTYHLIKPDSLIVYINRNLFKKVSANIIPQDCLNHFLTTHRTTFIPFLHLDFTAF